MVSIYCTVLIIARRKQIRWVRWLGPERASEPREACEYTSRINIGRTRSWDGVRKVGDPQRLAGLRATGCAAAIIHQLRGIERLENAVLF
jgi:hypothetical protein